VSIIVPQGDALGLANYRAFGPSRLEASISLPENLAAHIASGGLTIVLQFYKLLMVPKSPKN